MIMIIIMLAVFAVLWFTKKYWANYLVMLFKKSKAGSVQKSGTSPIIFMPVGTTRTFIIGIDITENGDGTVKMELAKMKQKDV